ncbi:MAG TPA: hypothetical protein DCM26_03310 [Desulfotomaculum sp.]|nr:hypothetical protein [Desulfotomaculum sp.]
MKKFQLPLVMFLALAFITSVILINAAAYPKKSDAGEVKKFSSYGELKSYVERNTKLLARFGGMFLYSGDAIRASGMSERVFSQEAAPSSAPQTKARENGNFAADAPADFSTTNIQVAGVDEADLVKSDGSYLYVVSGKEVVILKAYPAKEAKILSKISFAGSPNEVFINKNRLVVFENQWSEPSVAIKVYDITNRAKPVLKRDVAFRGAYVNSRMIDDCVYVIANVPVNDYKPDGSGEEKIKLPEITANGRTRIIPAGEIHYFDYPDYSYQYTLVISFNTQNDSREISSKTFLTGTAQNIYASQSNIYLTGPKAPNVALYTQRLSDGLAKMLPAGVAGKIKGLSRLDPADQAPELEKIVNEYFNGLSDEQTMVWEEKIAKLTGKVQEEIRQEAGKTVVHKLAIANGSVEYQCAGEVPGHVLNQFSMDEHKGFFRVATTTERFVFGQGVSSRNNLYILDQNMQIAGSLQGLAPAERIYSARFMGDRAYLVTFRQIDPLFVVDLKDPYHPKVLGELKIPGYSDYLHPYDENHLIGIGKEVSLAPPPEPVPLPETIPLNMEGNRESDSVRPEIVPPPVPRVQGLKIAFFDVSNPARPKEISKYVVDQEGSDSLALRDHKAFLFSKTKRLLVLPVSYPLPVRIQDGARRIPYYQGWQGAYVFDVTLDNGIALRGKVSHPDDEIAPLRHAPGYGVKRSLYIDNVFYTVSDSLVKMNDLESLREINQIRLSGN